MLVCSRQNSSAAWELYNCLSKQKELKPHILHYCSTYIDSRIESLPYLAEMSPLQNFCYVHAHVKAYWRFLSDATALPL